MKLLILWCLSINSSKKIRSRWPRYPPKEKTELDLMLEKHGHNNGQDEGGDDESDLAMLGIDPNDLAGFGS